MLRELASVGGDDQLSELESSRACLHICACSCMYLAMTTAYVVVLTNMLNVYII